MGISGYFFLYQEPCSSWLKNQMSKLSNLPKVSFIIPTLNASYFLPKCLEAIRSQDYPQENIEIVVADANSTDDTVKIAKKHNAVVIPNPEILHEPGKARASSIATGEIFFFTDADNVLSNKNWVALMIKAYMENPNIKGFEPQTIPAPDSNSLDRYMGYLSTDPFTWYVYDYAASPRTYGNNYEIVKKTNDYTIYKFPVMDHPLIGLSQGAGTVASFKREKMGHADDILSIIKLIEEGGLIAYVPKSGIYHYHVRNFSDFLKKYTWRIRNNYTQKIKGMGLVNRQKYLNPTRRLRQLLFIPYALSIIIPIIDSIKLFYTHKDTVMFWHPFATFALALLIVKETILFKFGIGKLPGVYGK